MNYFKDRLKERDTQTVIGAALYSIVRAFVPMEYQLMVDMIAGALGLGIAATPIKK